jgi:DNA replication protein DnaC
MTDISDDPEYVDFQALARKRQKERDLEWLSRKRPAEFELSGEMDPEVAAWFARLVDPEQDSGNLIICGSLGTGKSWHLWRIFADLVEHYDGAHRVECVTAYEFKQIAAPPTDYERLARLAKVGLLFLDDIGSVRLSDWDLENLFGIVDQRWSRQRPIVISSNALDMRALLGERIASRLAKNVTPVELAGEDRRRQS